MEVSKSLDELDEWCLSLKDSIPKGSVVLLQGTLGAGKSLLVQKFVQAFGGDQTASPTYSLINEYQTLERPQIFHVDLYRLQDDEDLESTGFWDLFNNESAVVFIEWPERLNQEDLPLHFKKIKINIAKLEDDFKRSYSFESFEK